MKREAVGHSKMLRLCRRLDIPRWQGIGLLESIWHLTAREAPRGDIGKLSDEDIALAIDYRGDESGLVDALVNAGWLDRDPEERLIVHDWADHADDAVNMRLARKRLFFAGGHPPKLTRLTGRERELLQEFYSCDHAVRTPCVPPEPEPEPVIKPLCASGDARVGNLPPIEDPPFATTLDALPEALNGRGNGNGRELAARQEAWFVGWWAEYWLKKAKKAARDAFRKQVKTEVRFQQVMAATRAQKPEMLQREPSKRPHGATWLNGERWEDELQPETKSASGVGYRDMDEWKGVRNDANNR